MTDQIKGKTLHTVLISQKAREMTDTLDVSGYPLQPAEDLRRDILDILRREHYSRFYLLIFLEFSEVPGVDAFLKGFDEGSLSYGLIVYCPDDDALGLIGEHPRVLDMRTRRMTSPETVFLVKKSFRFLAKEARHQEEQVQHDLRLLDTKNDQEALISIGKSLTVEKDPNKLLRSILFMSKKITGADAGSIFLVERGSDGEKLLRFRYSHTFSMELDYEEFTMPLNSDSIAGYVAVSARVLNIPDAYHLEKDSPVSFNDSFDRRHGYQTRSMLVVPMKNHVDEVIGVIQLINSKETMTNRGKYSGNEAYEVYLDTPEDFETKVVPFDSRYESLMESIAGQAAVALENSRMIVQIETQFEEFVKASVGAIESRDPATSGHSFRVSELCLSMAKAVNQETSGPLSTWHFNEAQLKELQFAALLHDFGKVYIDNSIFQKGKKLYPRDYDYLHMRLAFLSRTLELKHYGSERQKLLTARLKEIMDQVETLNEPKIFLDNLDEEVDKILSQQEELSGTDLEGREIPLLAPEEEVNLRIKRGTLNTEERQIIESHVDHTYTFVSKIPWPEEYSEIPEIARQHHEMLNGAGYPQGLKGPEILPQARMMAIADIFDALTASDRPYKKAVPLSKVLEILKEEAGRDKLDSNLVDLFISKKLYESVLQGEEA